MATINPSLIAVDFDEASHVYRVNGQEKISVTRVLKDNGLYHDANIPYANVKFGQDRGTKVHRAIKLLVEETLDVDNLDRQLVPFVSGVSDYLTHTGFVTIFAEEPMYHSGRDYCGTPDLIGQFPDSTWAVIDAKVGSGKVDPWVGVQLAAYANFFRSPLSYRRIALRLQENGEYRHFEFPVAQFTRDWNVFVSALNVTNWRKATT